MPNRAVVAGVVVHDGSVLAARRSRPAELAGRWEFPGGKVEPGETEPDALARELTEELAIAVTVGALLGRVPLADGFELAAYGCRLTSGTPTAGDAHDEVRWLAPDELATAVDWLAADRELLVAATGFARSG